VRVGAVSAIGDSVTSATGIAGASSGGGAATPAAAILLDMNGGLGVNGVSSSGSASESGLPCTVSLVVPLP